MIRRIFTLFLLALTLQLSAQTQGDPAPDFTVDLLGGGTFNLAANEGKVVLIFFFRNSCPNCVAAGPAVDGIFKTFEDNSDFTAIGVDVWPTSNPTLVSNFKTASTVTFPLGYEASGVGQAYSTSYDRLGVVDQEGTLVFKGASGASNDISTVTDIIQGLLTPSSVPELSDAIKLSLYPNPASQEVRLQFTSEAAGTGSFSMYDLTGRLKYEQAMEIRGGTQEERFPVSQLSEGVYMYRVTLPGNAPVSGRIILQQ